MVQVGGDNGGMVLTGPLASLPDEVRAVLPAPVWCFYSGHWYSAGDHRYTLPGRSVMCVPCSSQLAGLDHLLLHNRRRPHRPGLIRPMSPGGMAEWF